MIIPIIGHELKTVHKGLERDLKELEMRGRIGTIMTTLLLRSARKLTKAQET